MKIIERVLVFHDNDDQQSKRHADRQAQEIDDTEGALAREIAERGGDDTLEHIVIRYSLFVTRQSAVGVMSKLTENNMRAGPRSRTM
jgi:hypothetical protein